MLKGICYNASRQERRKCSLWHAKSPGVATSGAFLFRCGKVAYALGWLPPIYLRPAICRCSRRLHLPRQRVRKTKIYSWWHTPFLYLYRGGSVAHYTIVAEMPQEAYHSGRNATRSHFPLFIIRAIRKRVSRAVERPQRLPLILFFVGYHAGGGNGCPSVPSLPLVLHCLFRRKKVKGGLRPFFICCIR
jgi:hypothetical protein